MKTVSLSGSPRGNVGKKDAKNLRKSGYFPCVLYGGNEQIHFSLEEISFSKILFTPEVYLLDINIEGKTYKAILQDIQYHPVSDKILHADFLQVFDDKELRIALPAKTTGTAPGVMRGGKLTQNLRKLKVKGLVANLPDAISIDVSKLGIADSIKVKDLALDHVEFLDVPTQVVVSVKATRVSASGGEEEESGEETSEAPATE